MRLSERNFTTTSQQKNSKPCFSQHSFKTEQLKYGIADISNEQTKIFSPIQYQILRQAYLEILKKLELNDIVLARVINKHFNARYSEKLMHITATGKDTILVEYS